MTPEQELDLLMAEPLADDNVIHFKLAFEGSPRTYTYVGLKAGGQWWLTGREGATGMTWVELIDWIRGKNAEVISIRRATEWETL